MHTLGTVPQLLISDQTYLFNTCLVFILFFESCFFKSTLADFPLTTNFFPIAVHRLFPHPDVHNCCLLYYTGNDTFLPPR